LIIVFSGLGFLAAVQAMPRAEFMAPNCMDAAQTATLECCANIAMKTRQLNPALRTATLPPSTIRQMLVRGPSYAGIISGKALTTPL
jgi:hypothetical protein